MAKSNGSTWFEKLVKIVTISVVFLLATFSICVSKVSTLFLVSQLQYPGYNKQNLSCTRDNHTCSKFQHKESVAVADEAWLWCLLAALLFPELLTLLKSSFIVLTQHVHRPPLKHVLVPIFFQTLHCVGVCILFFMALPGMSVVTMSVILSSVCFIPAVFKTCSDRQKAGHGKTFLLKAMDVLCVLIQIGSIGLWTLYSDNHAHPWSVSVGLLLTSFGWWEAYLPYDNAIIFQSFFDFLREVRDKSLHRLVQHVVNCIVSLWKIILTLTMFFVLTAALKPVPNVWDLFSNTHWSYIDSETTVVTPGKPPAILINESLPSCLAGTKFVPYLAYPDKSDCSGFWLRVCVQDAPTLTYNLCPGDFEFFDSKNSLTCYNEGTCCQAAELVECGARQHYQNCPNPEHDIQEKFPSNPDAYTGWQMPVFLVEQNVYPFLALLIQIISTFAAYQLSYFAFETRIEISGFAIPMTLSTLILIPALALVCNNEVSDNCYYDEFLSASRFFSCSDYMSLFDLLKKNWIFILTFLSQAWISSHIWTKRTLRLAKKELIFDTPFYDSLMIEQSLLLNRRMDDEKTDQDEILMETVKREVTVIGCATMWHETESEMSDLLDSLLRIDAYAEKLDRTHEDFFDFELNIFFDDAFDADGNPNAFVIQLLKLLEVRHIDLKEKTITPYGGKLKWILSNNTVLLCHLKDRTKIKIKKRWSQLMYFLYFLGEQAVENLEEIRGKNYYSNETIRVKNSNTFILALDGDVTFEPNSIVKLIDLMKKDDKTGAVCGRIHPKGAGLISMYQKFEYAVGHWLQKTTEDVLGNVLCSPGCFSLYRLSALIESQISFMKPALKDFTKATASPMDCIQHDQGEDRWLCTMLIERGWNIEYSAVSDAYTVCPESFSEFYHQRRRWTPSTVANLLELLSLWRSLLRHGNLSIFHILYQILMLAGTVIGPGSIFILLVGGFQLTLDVSYWTSFIFNLIPIIMFIVVSLLASPSSQILCAKVLSLIYGLFMIAIVFALLFSVWDGCPWAPSTVSLELTAGAFIIVGLLHPLELHYLLYGVVYYATVPCMYMLLPFFCVFNLDDVSWGTRETAQVAKKNSMIERLRYIFNPADEIDELGQKLTEKMDSLEKTIEKLSSKDDGDQEITDEADAGLSNWTQALQGELTILDSKEELLFENMIEKYLKPEQLDKKTKELLKEKLEILKNEVSLMFLFINAAWAVGIFLLQLSAVESSAFTLDWVLCPVDQTSAGVNATSAAGNGTEEITDASTDTEYMPLDPINFVFILFFLIVLFIQVVGMMFHRIGTVGHIVASTEIFNQDVSRKFSASLRSDDISMVDGRPALGVENPVFFGPVRMSSLREEIEESD